MPQILKKEINDKIIEVAKSELLKNGIESASMRNIAKGAGISTGNLYRYYIDKDDLIKNILNPCFSRLEKLVSDVTKNKVILLDMVTLNDLSIDDITLMMNKIIDGLVEIYNDYHDEFLILLLDKKISNNFELWIVNLICKLVDKDESDAFVIKANIASTMIVSSFKKAFELFEKQKFDLALILKQHVYKLLELLR